jgi:hypothetical protein
VTAWRGRGRGCLPAAASNRRSGQARPAPLVFQRPRPRRGPIAARSAGPSAAMAAVPEPGRRNIAATLAGGDEGATSNAIVRACLQRPDLDADPDDRNSRKSIARLAESRRSPSCQCDHADHGGRTSARRRQRSCGRFRRRDCSPSIAIVPTEWSGRSQLGGSSRPVSHAVTLPSVAKHSSVVAPAHHSCVADGVASSEPRDGESSRPSAQSRTPAFTR